ncbi:MAG: sensor domain-containing diguanylate cyclase [Desulfobaccales bacterium]
MIIEPALHQHYVEAQMRLATMVFENAGEGILVTDRQSKVITVNQAFTEITGYAPEEIIGQTLELLQAEPPGAESPQNIWATLRTTGKWQGEIWYRRKNGEAFPAWLTLRAVGDQQGRIANYVGMLTDITFRRQAEDRLRYLATHDPLTGLANRYLFQDHLHQALAQARRSERSVAVMLMDLDRFKIINDTLGHAIGDLVLKEEAERLQGSIRESDTAARLGGDEFLVLLTELTDLEDTAWIAGKILEAMARPYVFDGQEYAVAASIGISLFPLHGEDPEVLIKNADTAMYCAKERGNCWVFYAPEAQGGDLLHLQGDPQVARYKLSALWA